MTERTDRKSRLRARERILATLSHEIRTPLNGVMGMAGLLAETRLDPTQQAYLKALQDCGEHLLGLVNDALDYAKLDAQPVRLEPTPTDVEALLQGVCELLSPRAYAAGIEIAWATDGLVPPVLADDGRLRQILFNLAGNAVKLTKTGGVRLMARASATDARRLRLRFEVVDTGPGVPETQQAVIFEEFVQTETGEIAGGAGLGLAIVRRLADAFDGEVGVVTPPSGGACFWFEAEFHRADRAAPAITALNGARVALVSPSAIVRDAASAQIAVAGGRPYGCTRMADIPADAQVALIDSALWSGRRGAPPKAIPSLILLAPEERRRIAAARQAGFAGYLIKPLRRASVAERVSALLAAPTTAPAPATAPLEDERAAAPAVLGARVLLAEDNPVNALLARTLLTHAGCSVDRVASGEEALAAARAAPYDLILMDVRMPGVDGITASRRLRDQGLRTPIVALTANAFDEDRRACLEAGMNDFLTKPLDPAALRALLSRWVAPRPAAAAKATHAA